MVAWSQFWGHAIEATANGSVGYRWLTNVWASRVWNVHQWPTVSYNVTSELGEELARGVYARFVPQASDPDGLHERSTSCVIWKSTLVWNQEYLPFDDQFLFYCWLVSWCLSRDVRFLWDEEMRSLISGERKKKLLVHTWSVPTGRPSLKISDFAFIGFSK